VLEKLASIAAETTERNCVTFIVAGGITIIGPPAAVADVPDNLLFCSSSISEQPTTVINKADSNDFPRKAIFFLIFLKGLKFEIIQNVMHQTYKNFNSKKDIASDHRCNIYMY
jgi:hypothetical protein